MSIDITDRISISEFELDFEFVRSSGPGGQKVNKTSSAVVLRFDAMGSPSLPDHIKNRLKDAAGKHLNSSGEIVLRSQKYRSQYRNRENVIRKLVKIIRKAAWEPRRRIRTKPTEASNQKRLVQKKRRSWLKKQRNYRPSKEDFR